MVDIKVQILLYVVQTHFLRVFFSRLMVIENLYVPLRFKSVSLLQHSYFRVYGQKHTQTEKQQLNQENTTDIGRSSLQNYFETTLRIRKPFEHPLVLFVL